MTDQIVEICKSRNIPYLLHFTRLENIDSIIANGLAPRAMIDDKKYNAVVNDQVRADKRTTYNSLSVSFPNSKMLYKYLNENPDQKWIILAIQTDVLWTHNVLFCSNNAANSHISALPTEALSTPDAFQQMFDEIDEHPSRKAQFLKNYDPTDVQAELLVEGVISPQYIKAIAFQQSADRDKFKDSVGGRKCVVHNNKGLFGDRTYVRQYHTK